MNMPSDNVWKKASNLVQIAHAFWPSPCNYGQTFASLSPGYPVKIAYAHPEHRLFVGGPVIAHFRGLKWLEAPCSQFK